MSLYSQWKALETQLRKLQRQINKPHATFAFSFVEVREQLCNSWLLASHTPVANVCHGLWVEYGLKYRAQHKSLSHQLTYAYIVGYSIHYGYATLFCLLGISRTVLYGKCSQCNVHPCDNSQVLSIHRVVVLPRTELCYTCNCNYVCHSSAST